MILIVSLAFANFRASMSLRRQVVAGSTGGTRPPGRAWWHSEGHASDPMSDLVPRRVRTARFLAEVSVYSVAVAITITSAVIAKQATAAPPPLAAVEPVPSEPASNASTDQALVFNAWSAAPTTAENEQVIELPATDDTQIRYFDGRPIRPVKTIWMTVTAYSPDHRSCAPFADGITASGRSVWTNAGNLVAADTRILPFNSLITVPGYAAEEVVPVLDRGGAIKGARLDVLYPTHERALQWGVQRLPITVWEYAD